jgi:hypothetical protein
VSDKTLAERGAITTNDLMLRLFGRDFGTVMEDATRFQQPVPSFLQPIVSELKAASAILKLDIGANEDAIFDAYKHDVRFLQHRLDQLAGWVRTCIQASVKSNDNYTENYRVKTGWDFVQQHIPSIAHAPLIDLPAERAALPADQLLAELKQEVVTGIDSMMKRFCLWLDLLVAKEYVGLVHFTGPTVGHYYYFRPYTTDKVAATNRNEVEIDRSVPYGEQTTYTTIERQQWKITESVERHDHHIVKAKVNTLSDYTGLIPYRIIRALDRAPDWLRPHLRVISGDITKEVVARRIVREQEGVHERVTSVYKDSPAIALGAYAFNGWSSDDTSREESGHFSGQKVYSAAKRVARSQTMRTFLLVFAVIGLIVGGIWYWVHSSNVSSQASYDQYYAKVTAGSEIFTIAKEKMITLPRGEPLYYLGLASNGRDANVSTDRTTRWKAYPEQFGQPQLGNFYQVTPRESAPNTYYGTVDLMDAKTGIPARMNILYADKEKMSFTIDYYIK